MPTRTWLIDTTTVELVDRGGMGVTVRAGDFTKPLPIRTIGAWPIPIDGRKVRIEARRNLDVLRYFVFSDDHPVPRGSTAHRDAAPDSKCAKHDQPATCRCARCDATSCTACAPDGHHCGACAWAMFAEENARIRRVRTWAVLGSLAAFAIILAIAFVFRVQKLVTLGAGGLVLTLVLTINGWRSERRERRAGYGAAVDPRFAAQPEARTKRSR